jgi:GDP-4-dehydro-6-deoxy-D-mannose reductase
LKVLITGIAGFVGGHLVNHLQTKGTYEIYGTVYGKPEERLSEPVRRSLAGVWPLDIVDPMAVREIVEQSQPDLIFHLAAQSHVPTAFKDPWGTLETNIRGTLNLFEAVLSLELTKARIVNVISANVYGVVKPEDLPLTEEQNFNPGDPYAVSKIAQDMLGHQYASAHGLSVMQARAFNHTGPGQTTLFVVPNFATQIAEIEQGQTPPVLKVGNLKAERDYLDVRDVVKAYEAIALQGAPGEAYNVCSGEAHSIESFVDTLLAMSTADIEVEVDEARLRPLDLPRLAGDSSKLRQTTDWEPTIPIDQMLRDVLEDCRQRVSVNQRTSTD